MMAKIAFSKLAAKPNAEVKTINFNNTSVEVKQYLPIQEKIALIEYVTNGMNNDETGYKFVNYIQQHILTVVGFIKYYTNLSFTEKQMEDIYKFYDSIYGSGLCEAVIEAIPQDEYDLIMGIIDDIVKSIYDYKTSFLGIMEATATDYKNLEFDAEKIKKDLADRNGVEFLQEVLNKMG